MNPQELYLTQVLGLRHLSVEPTAMTAPRLIFLIRHAFTPPAQVLFLKMTEAMKLKPSDYLIFEREIPAQFQAVPLVVHFFSIEQAPEHWYEIESPEILLIQPELKKKAWADLQIVMKMVMKLIMKQISIVEPRLTP